MKKTKTVIYWIATAWLSLGMLSTGAVQLLGIEGEDDFMTQLGYPPYVPAIIGAWKILGVLAVLVPRLPLLKEWAYAGFFFVMSGALFSHLSAGSAVSDILPVLLLLALTVVSWCLRPASRKPITFNQTISGKAI